MIAGAPVSSNGHDTEAIDSVQASSHDSSDWRGAIMAWRPSNGVGRQILESLQKPGSVRHNVLVERDHRDELISAEMAEESGCRIWALTIRDEMGVMGVPADVIERFWLVVLVGTDAQCERAKTQVRMRLDPANQMLDLGSVEPSSVVTQQPADAVETFVCPSDTYASQPTPEDRLRVRPPTPEWVDEWGEEVHVALPPAKRRRES